MARPRAVGEVGTAPPLSTLDPVPVRSALRPSPHDAGELEDEVEDDLKAASDGSDTEVEQEFDDEESLLLRESARLDAEEAALKAQRVAKLRRKIARQAANIAALRAEDDDGLDSLTGAPRAAATVEQTPSREPQPRRPLFQSATGRKPPNAATVARLASIGQLPDITPVGDMVSVNIAPVIAGSGRASSTVTHVLPAAAEASRAAYRAMVAKPEKLSGDDPVQNERVASWVAEINRFLRLSKVPSEDHLDTARSYVMSKGSAEAWISAREQEVAGSGKQLTWDWLQVQLIQHYALPTGAAAMQAEWQALRMGIKSADGTDTGKSTWSVRSYTNRFLHYMRQLTKHTVQTDDVLVIDRYVAGIQTGYDALYRVMLGVQKVLRFATLQEAISAAEEAEADIAIAKIAPRSSSSSSASSSRYGEGAGRAHGYRGGRAATESLNSLQGEYSDEGETEESSRPPRAKSQLNGFRFVSLPADGRHKLSEKEQRMLYDERRCYRCYGQHPVGRGQPACTKPAMKAAPKPLN